MITIINSDPYSSLLTGFITRQFPSVVKQDSRELVETISTILLGTKEYRFGPLPSVESQVVIRRIIRKSIESESRIPILVPWGSIKGDFSSMVDIAELFAIKRLICINEEIKRFYYPGLDIVIRVEDKSGYSLFEMDALKENLIESIDNYSDAMVKLVNMLSENTIQVVKETNMHNAASYEQHLRKNLKLMYNYILNTEDIVGDDPREAMETKEYKELVEAGWKGYISHEQRWHYYEAYIKLYNDENRINNIRRLSLYLAGSLTKKQLGMNGVKSSWNNEYIQITFVPPVKGLPEGFADHYIYYRTLPMSSARTHMSPWRSRGYLRIVGNDILPKLTTFNDKELIDELIPSVTTLQEMGTEVLVRTDYLLVS